MYSRLKPPASQRGYRKWYMYLKFQINPPYIVYVNIFILRHPFFFSWVYMWRHIDVQADWRSWTYGRAPTPLTFRKVILRVRPSINTGTPFLWLFRETAPFQSPFTKRTWIRRIYYRLKPTGPQGGGGGGGGYTCKIQSNEIKLVSKDFKWQRICAKFLR